MALPSVQQWLGFRRDVPVAGLHVATEVVTLAVLRRDPVRVVALGRFEVPESVVVDGEIRLLRPVTIGLQGLMQQLRLPPNTPTVVTMEPSTTQLTAHHGIDGDHCACQVARAVHHRLIRVASQAGLRVTQADVVPASLARIWFGENRDTVAIKDPSGWSILSGPDFFEAERTGNGSRVKHLRVGPDLSTTRKVDRLPGIEIPRQLAAHANPKHDAAAVGAALAGFGCAPLFTIEPIDQPTVAVSTLQAPTETGTVAAPVPVSPTQPAPARTSEVLQHG